MTCWIVKRPANFLPPFPSAEPRAWPRVRSQISSASVAGPQLWCRPARPGRRAAAGPTARADRSCRASPGRPAAGPTTATVGLREAGVADQPVSQTKVCDTRADRGAPSSSFRSRCVRSRRRITVSAVPVVELRRLRRRVPPRFAGRAQVARCRRRERPRPVRESAPRGRKDVRLDAAAGGGRGGRRDVDADGETGVREPHGRSRRRRPSPPRTRRRPPRPRRVFRGPKPPPRRGDPGPWAGPLGGYRPPRDAVRHRPRRRARGGRPGHRVAAGLSRRRRPRTASAPAAGGRTARPARGT